MPKLYKLEKQRTVIPMIQCFLVKGTSMEPTLRDGDIAIIQPLRREPKVDDILVYQAPAPGFPVIHRVVAVDPKGIIMAGDSNGVTDPGIISIDHVLGKVVLRIPMAGKFVMLLRRFLPPWNEKTGTEVKRGASAKR